MRSKLRVFVRIQRIIWRHTLGNMASEGEIEMKNSKYYCESCNFYSNDKSKFERHISTTKHKKVKGAINIASLICDCGKSYKHSSSYHRHRRSCKKLLNTDVSTDVSIANDLGEAEHRFSCSCGKSYKHRQSLHNHKKTCSDVIVALGDTSTVKLLDSLKEEIHAMKNDFQSNMKMELQEEFQNKMVETLKELLPQLAISNITNNNITNNTRISNNQINIFLNEKCANAMTIQEFAKQLSFSIDDVLLNQHDAFVTVINNNLKPIAATERPVHCTNAARRKWYVNDEKEGWRNDDGSTLIRSVGNALLRRSPAKYAEEHPDFYCNPDRQDEYTHISLICAKEMEPKAEARVLTAVVDNALLNLKEVTT